MTRPTVTIVGGGLAGLAAAVALAPRGFAVTVLESRPRLGGRASSFADPTTGQLIDACQHVSMGCCTNFHHFCAAVGVGHLLEPQSALYFQTPDARVSVFKSDPWPAPFHLGRALLGAHYLTASEKLRIGYGLLRMLVESPDADPPLEPWLLRHRQTRRTIDRFWGVVLVSALNETVDRVGLKYARKVFRDGFIRHRDGFTVHVPAVPLAKLYGEELSAWMATHGVTVRTGCGVRTLVPLSPGGEGDCRSFSATALPSLPISSSWRCRSTASSTCSRRTSPPTRSSRGRRGSRPRPLPASTCGTTARFKTARTRC